MLLFEGATTATFMWVDVVICFVLFVGFFIGWKKGFVDQLFSLVGIVAVLVLAVLMCKPIANALMATDKGVIFDKISGFLTEKLGSWEHYTTTQVVWSDVETNKGLINSALEMLGLPSFLISLGIFNGIFKGFSTQPTTLQEQLPQQLTTYVNYIVAFLILFVVLFIAVMIVKSILKKIVSQPLLKQVDQFLGILFGVLKNFVIIIAVFTAITFLSSIIQPLGNFMNETVYGVSWIGQKIIKPIMELVLQYIAK